MRDRCRAVLLVVALSATHAAPAHAQRATLDPGTAAAWAALLEVHDTRRVDTAVIDVALASHTVALRAAALRVVGMNRIEARYPALRGLLHSARDTQVVRDAAFALGLAADAGACGPLTDALASGRGGEAAAWALGELGAQCGGFAALLAAARPPAVRAALLRVAGKWDPFPDSIVAAAFAAARSHDERWAALYALARARRNAGGALALRASRDAAPDIRELAARLLAAPLHGDAASPARARLVALLRDPAPHVRVAAVRALATYGALAAAPLALAWRLERDVNVRVTMAQAAGGVAGADAAPWIEWWRDDTTHMVRTSLLASAWQAGAIERLERGAGSALSADPDPRIRVAMIEGAASTRPALHAAMFTRGATDAHAAVRAASVGALAALPAPVRDSVGWARIEAAAASDPDPGVRQAITDARVRGARATDVGFALAGYARALADSVPDARESALALIAAAWRRDSAQFGDSAVTALAALAPDADVLLRRRVEAVTPLRHWRLAPTSGASPASYRRIVHDVIAPSLAGRPPQLVLDTERGAVRIRLDGVQAPMTAAHLSALARRGYFTGQRFHRVVPAFVAQGGDPRGDGSGGPGYAIRDELNRSPYRRGAVGMALAGPDTGGSQFFLTLAPQPHLDGHYTVFGQVIAGQRAMDALVQGDALRSMTPLP
ncbi:MAG: peptidylprolyl isomerase [Gemmatimonadaceae bacterium]|nr:peptidylprolyl isomerase [Gemmatimonadaceae bacterium]